MATEKFDLVVYGASGYTGKFVVKEVARKVQTDKQLTWAIAGRSRAKLLTCLKLAEQELGTDLSSVQVIIAHTDDYDSLLNMAAKCKVVINCVGPYSVHGEPVVRACIENGTSQVDLTGEHEYIEETILLYNQKALDKGCYIIGACGYGFLHEELSLLFAKKEFQGKLTAVDLFAAVNTKGEKVGINMGTYHSMLQTLGNQSKLKEVRKLMPKVDMPKPDHPIPSSILSRRDDGRFYMMGDVTPISRTQREEYRVNGTTPIDYHCHTKIGYLSTVVQAFFALLVIVFMNLTSFGQNILLKFPRLFTFGVVHPDGPPEEMVKEQSYVTTINCYGYSSAEGKGRPDKRMTLQLSGPDPAYIATSSMLVESAMTLLREKDKLPDSGGVMTPGFAFKHSTMIERLEQRDIKFEVISG